MAEYILTLLVIFVGFVFGVIPIACSAADALNDFTDWLGDLYG